MSEIQMAQFPMKFFNTIKAREDDLLDFGEEFEPIKKFFSGDQKKIFDDVLRVLGIYEKSKTYIVDKEIEDTSAAIRSIINLQAPYGRIQELVPLRDKFIKANVKLLSEKSEPVKKAIAEARQRVFDELSGKLCQLSLL